MLLRGLRCREPWQQRVVTWLLAVYQVEERGEEASKAAVVPEALVCVGNESGPPRPG